MVWLILTLFTVVDLLSHLLLADVREGGCNDCLSGVVLCRQAVDCDLVDQIISELHVISLDSPEQVIDSTEVSSEIYAFSHLQHEDLSVELVPAHSLAYIEELLELGHHICRTVEALDGVSNIGM